MTLQNQIKAWVVLLVVAIALLWLFRGILLPFIAGLGLAYLLDPLADRLEKLRFPRFWAASLIMLCAILIFATAFFLVVPLAVQQAFGLAQRLPGYVSQLQTLASEWSPQLKVFLGADRMAQLQSGLGSLISQGVGIAGNLLGQVMQSGATLINALGLLIITPVVAFYSLLDWDKLTRSFDDLLPRAHREEIREVLTEIDKAMSGVIRGQAGVVLMLCVYYPTALSIAGINYGIAIGLMTGILSFIPYAGLLVGLLLSLGVAIVQDWPQYYLVVAVLAVFGVGQFLEGNVLYPKFVGSSIGVHPVWLMFSLFAFALVFGFVGILLAVPLSAIASVLMRYVVRKYRESPLYLEKEGEESGQPPAA